MRIHNPAQGPGRSRFLRSRFTTLEAILLRLWLKVVAGDPRALKTWLKFQEFARQFSNSRVEIVFVDNEYTTAFAAIPLDKDEDDE